MEQRLRFQIRQQLKKEKVKRQREISTQTGDFNFYLCLGRNKCLHIDYSKSYRDKVICLKFSNNKKYIITRQIWNIIKQNFTNIDNEFNQ
jgi:hypothetical protein